MKPKVVFLILFTYGFVSCRKSVGELTPAQAVSGTFLAKTYNDIVSPLMTYPINGKTIKLQINPVSTDSVRVQVFSTQNGYYSPGDSTIYSKAFVKSINCLSCQYPRTYTITLAPPTSTGTADNTIWFDLNNNAYYTYIPPGYTKGDVQTVFVKMN
jgi:hypothetical protein